MGYTNYWSYLPDHAEFVDAWPQITADARRIIDVASDLHDLEVGPGVDDYTGHHNAETNETWIWLNGPTPAEGCETLLIWGPGGDARERISHQLGWLGDVDYVWGFCKTARLPYDTVVCAILLRCRVLCPRAFAIGSDGKWGAEWADGAWDGDYSPRALYRDCFGAEPDQDPLAAGDVSGGPPASRKRAVQPDVDNGEA
jgi:hypothetical protein